MSLHVPASSLVQAMICFGVNQKHINATVAGAPDVVDLSIDTNVSKNAGHETL